MKPYSDGTESWHPDNTSGFGVGCRPGEQPRIPTPKAQPELRQRTEYGFIGYRGEVAGPFCPINRAWLLGKLDNPAERGQDGLPSKNSTGQTGIIPGVKIGG